MDDKSKFTYRGVEFTLEQIKVLWHIPEVKNSVRIWPDPKTPDKPNSWEYLKLFLLPELY